MALKKEKETLSPITQRNSTILGSSAFQDDSDDDYILNYFREQYFYDRQGDRDNIIRENTIQTIEQDMILRVNQASVIAVERRTPIRGNWRRTGQGSWIPSSETIDNVLPSDSEYDYSF